MFLKVTDLDTGKQSLINPERIDVIKQWNSNVYIVVYANTSISISPADFARLCTAVGYAMGNGSDPVNYESIGSTIAALMGLWTVINEIDELACIPDPNFVRLVSQQIDRANAIMDSWKNNQSKYQVPPHDQMPDPLGGLGEWADKEVEDDDD
jgi:hypothetical protein